VFIAKDVTWPLLSFEAMTLVADSIFEVRSWLARVWSGGEARMKIIGTAFVIDGSHLLTCAHVVQDAGARGPGGRVYVDFPLLKSKGTWAEVLPEGWRPIPPADDAQSVGDTALLQLEVPIPGFEPLPLRSRPSYKGLRFACYGFPTSNPESEAAHGSLGLNVGLEWLRVEPDSNALVEPGFSGAAVWDDDARGAVAMIVTRRSGNGQIAYAVPLKIVAAFSRNVANALTGSAAPLSWLDRAPRTLETELISFRTLITKSSENFVGRDFVLPAIENRMSDLPSGYIFIRGEPGIGKSALIAKLAQTHGYVHHFNLKSDNVRSPAQFLRNSCAQLIVRYGLPHNNLPPDTAGSAKILEMLLEEASQALADSSSSRVVLLLDALDEAEEPPRGVNRLWLPRSLPERTYIVATIRSKVDPLLKVEDKAKDIVLEKNSVDNKADIAAFVSNFAHREWQTVQDRVKWARSREDFITVVCERSEGNFMYLHYVLSALRKREDKTGPQFLDIEDIPSGLEGYYAHHWNAMKDLDRSRFKTLQVPILCMLARAGEAIPIETVVEWINDSGYFKPTEYTEVENVFEDWAEFLQEVPGTPSRYRLYHASFLEFLDRTVGLQKYVKIIASAMKNKSERKPSHE
jgi:Trypsin-like peptidase domain/NACHT domain